MAPRQRTPPRTASSDEYVGPASFAESKPLVSVNAVDLSAKPLCPNVDRPQKVGMWRAEVGPDKKKTQSGSNVSLDDRDSHDLFNLVALPCLIILTVINYDWNSVLGGMGPEIAWTDRFFIPYWSITMLYFFVDLFWVRLIPTCVKEPGDIVKHHIAAMIYLIAPVYLPEFRWCMGACLSAELSSWFLIARRVAFLRKNLIPTAVTWFLTVMFYASWIVIRLMLYPYIMAIYVGKARVVLDETGTLMHWPVIFLPVHFILCLMNFRWTLGLLYPILRKRFQSAAEKDGVCEQLNKN